MFTLSLVGQALTGFSYYNQSRTEHGESSVTFWHWLATGTFLSGIWVNWQAATLQLGSLIVFGAFLHQRGASHSRKTESEEGGGGSGDDDSSDDGGSSQTHRWSWIYRHSLSLAFVTMFFVSFVLNVFTGDIAYNEQASLSHQRSLSVISYLISGNLWFKVFQAWEAEFAAIFLFLVLSVVLREERSAESKPISASDKETGETNE